MKHPHAGSAAASLLASLRRDLREAIDDQTDLKEDRHGK
jgi:hypothetical protein